MKIRTFFIITCYSLIFYPFIVAFGQITIIPKYDMSEFDRNIVTIYKTSNSHSKSIEKRLKTDSQYFMGKPYLLSALGEGPKGLFDKNPLYRTDAFDCTTFVSTLLALVKSDSLAEFKKNIIKVRYKHANISFVNRNHFISVDWNTNNKKNGYLKDINEHILDINGKPIAVDINTLLDKPERYKNLPITTIKAFHKIPRRKSAVLLKKLHRLSSQVQAERSHMSYLPMNKLFTANKANQHLFKQIPSGVVIEIVRQDEHLKTLIGTDLNISHMGLGIRSKGRLIFREASFSDQQVEDIDLQTYLKQFIDDASVKGIHLEKIL